MDINKCPLCGRYTYRRTCPQCDERLQPEPDYSDVFPCRNCAELPFCPDASQFATRCYAQDYYRLSTPDPNERSINHDHHPTH